MVIQLTGVPELGATLPMSMFGGRIHCNHSHDQGDRQDEGKLRTKAIVRRTLIISSNATRVVQQQNRQKHLPRPP
jgi:hypothetical protein